MRGGLCLNSKKIDKGDLSRYGGKTVPGGWVITENKLYKSNEIV